MGDKKYFYTWKNFDKDVKKLASELKRKKPASGWDGVWGPARGGLPIAVCLSHSLNLPFLEKPKSNKTLIVDDIADSGKTLEKFFKKGHTIATIFYHRQSAFEPHIWLREKKSRWIVFPWEKQKADCLQQSACFFINPSWFFVPTNYGSESKNFRKYLEHPRKSLFPNPYFRSSKLFFLDAAPYWT